MMNIKLNNISINYLLLLLIYFQSCTTKEYKKIEFKDQEFYDNIEMDKYYKYIYCLKSNVKTNCNIIVSEFDDLQLEKYIISNKDTFKMNQMTEFQVNYFDNDSISRFIALAYFLHHKKFATTRLYDEMLVWSISSDTSNLVANYELAKLRFKEKREGLSMFLIDQLSLYIPDNKEVERIKGELHTNYKKFEYDSNMNYFKYLSIDPLFLY